MLLVAAALASPRTLALIAAADDNEVSEQVENTINRWWTQMQSWFGPFWPLMQAAVAIVIALIIYWVMKRVIRRLVDRVVSGAKKRHGVQETQQLAQINNVLVSPLAAVRTVQRTRTLGGILTSILTGVIFVVTTFVVLTILVPNVMASLSLLSAALGAGLGFGAQNLVRDFLNGMFIVAEDQLGIGDIVTMGDATGVVEHVGVRVTQIRAVDGTLWFVRNGAVDAIGNSSIGWANAVVDLAIPYNIDVRAMREELLRVATEMSKDQEWRRLTLAAPEVWSLQQLSAEALVMRIVVKVLPGEQWGYARELRVRCKELFDDKGIELPMLRSVVLDTDDGTVDSGKIVISTLQMNAQASARGAKKA